MFTEWRVATLQEVCTRITDGAHNSPKTVDTGLPMASVKDLTPFGITLETCRLISVEDFNNLVRQGCKPEPNDVLIAKDGNSALETVCIIKAPTEVVLLSSVAIIRPNPKLLSSSFLRYYLDAPSTRSYLRNFITGAAIPRVVLKDFRQALIMFPSIDEQERIAAILSAYDDLIENNQRRIKLLEQAARDLYQEWFVHFRFPGHEHVEMVDSGLGQIPTGWDVGRLEDALLLQRGFDLPHKERRPGNIPVFAATGIVGWHDEAKVTAPGVVTGRSGSLGSVLYIQNDFWALNTALWVREFRRVSPIYAFYLLRDLKLEKYNSGAAVPTLNRNDIHGLPVLIPPRELLSLFEDYAKPLFAFIQNLKDKNEVLQQTRDLLLPRLISGELDVSNLDIPVSEELAVADNGA